MKHKHISTLNEKPLHAALKAWYAELGDESEVEVDGYLVDLVRNGLLIEIQTRGFVALKRKLARLTEKHAVRLVYPIAREKWIVRTNPDGRTVLGRRKSPKRGRLEDLFVELVSFPELLAHPRFSLEILFIREEERRSHDAKRAWKRKGWVTRERRLLDIVERRTVEGVAGLAALVPPTVHDPFTTADLAREAGIPRWLAQKMAYCLRGAGAVSIVGKRGNAILYCRASDLANDVDVAGSTAR